MKGLLMKWVFMISWAISALVAINVGLAPFGFDFFTTEFVLMNLYRFIAPIHYIILISGLISLGLFVMSCSGHCSCDKCNGSKSSCGCK